MPLLVLIDGLEMATSSDDHTLQDAPLPVLARLAATGQTGLVHFSDDEREPEEGGAYFKLFGDFSSKRFAPDQDLPLGYATALALDTAGFHPPDPQRTWCCLGFTHLYRKRDDLLFLSPERTGQTQEACQHLAEACLSEFQAEGWMLHQRPEEDPAFSASQGIGVLSRAHSPETPVMVRTHPLSCLEGRSFRTHQPSGPHANILMRLLTNGQLALARHPLNLERERTGRVTLNTPWIWGVGDGLSLPSIPPTPTLGHCWTAHPVVAGLARASGHTVATMDEMADFSPLVAQIPNAMASGSVLIHLHGPALLARHGLTQERETLLKRVNDQLLEPLTQHLAERHHVMVIASSHALTHDGRGSHQPVSWITASGRALSKRRRFWHRGSPGRGERMTPDRFRTHWYPS